MSYVYQYPRPMVTVDAVVFRDAGAGIEVLLICRKNPPFAGKWALPGGFVDMDEDLLDAAARELFEETGLCSVELTQLGAFGRPDRDPRGRSIAVAYVGIVSVESSAVKAGDDAALAQWFPAQPLENLAFDHAEIICTGLKWLKKH